jgi:hypothetical protein
MLQNVNVLPVQVAIWIKALLLFSFRDFSKFVIASICTFLRFAISKIGRFFMYSIACFSCFASSSSLFGVWKVKTYLLFESGSK